MTSNVSIQPPNQPTPADHRSSCYSERINSRWGSLKESYWTWYHYSLCGGCAWTLAPIIGCLSFISICIIVPFAASVDASGTNKGWDLVREAMVCSQRAQCWSKCQVSWPNVNVTDIDVVRWWPHNTSRPDFVACDTWERTISEELNATQLVSEPLVDRFARLGRSPNRRCVWRQNEVPSMSTVTCRPCMYSCSPCSNLACVQEVHAAGCGDGLSSVSFECAVKLQSTTCVPSSINTTLCECQTVSMQQMDLISCEESFQWQVELTGRANRIPAQRLQVFEMERRDFRVLASLAINEFQEVWIQDFASRSTASMDLPTLVPVQHNSESYTYNNLVLLDKWYIQRTLAGQPSVLKQPLDVWIYVDDRVTRITGLTFQDPYQQLRYRLWISVWVLVAIFLCNSTLCGLAHCSSDF